MICLVFVVVGGSFHEAKANAGALVAMGSTAVAGEAAAVLSVLAAAGVIAVTAVGAYVLYSYVKSKYANSYLYDANSNSIVLKDVSFINDLKNSQVSIDSSNVIWQNDVSMYIERMGAGVTVELCTLPVLPTGAYYLYLYALVVGGDFTYWSGITPYNSNACIAGKIALGGYQYPYDQGARISVTFSAVNDVTGYYINGYKDARRLCIADFIASKMYSSGYPTLTGYGFNKIKVVITPRSDVTAVSGQDYVLQQGKDLVGYLDKPIALNPPADDTIDIEKLKDMYYVPALRDTAITSPTTTTDITLSPPTGVPTDRVAPPSLSIPEVITTKFPFSLPWDYYRLLKLMGVEGERFNISFKLFNTPMELNFNKFEDLIFILRKILFLAFLFAMLSKTVVLLKGGDN